jgi:hypothetical protein
MTCPTNDQPVSSQKRIIGLFALLAVLLVVGWTEPAHAQGRARSRGPRVGVVVGGHGYYPPPYMYDPWYGAGQWGMFPPYYGRYNVEPDSAVRLEVKPQEAEVYVDGYFAGIVDDFDGIFQRLHVAPGEHQIELYLDGYRSVRQMVYLTPNNTIKLKYAMERVATGQPMEPRPISRPPGPDAGAPPPMWQPGVAEGRGPDDRRMPPPPQAPYPPYDPRGGGQPSAAYGTLAIRVQPGDAEVVIDGETWRSPDSLDRLLVDVAEGRHTVEIRKAGYRTYVTDVQVRPGESTPLNVSLRSQNEP